MVWVREDDKRNLRPTLYILTYLNGDEGESESQNGELHICCTREGFNELDGGDERNGLNELDSGDDISITLIEEVANASQKVSPNIIQNNILHIQLQS